MLAVRDRFDVVRDRHDAGLARNRGAGLAIGSVAFGVSALGGFITESGVTGDAPLANVGTFIGALCFLVAALLVLP